MESRMSSADMSFDPPSDSDDEYASHSPSNYISDQNSDPAELIEKDDFPCPSRS